MVTLSAADGGWLLIWNCFQALGPFFDVDLVGAVCSFFADHMLAVVQKHPIAIWHSGRSGCKQTRPCPLDIGMLPLDL